MMTKTQEDNYEFLKDTGINVGPVSEKILNSIICKVSSPENKQWAQEQFLKPCIQHIKAYLMPWIYGISIFIIVLIFICIIFMFKMKNITEIKIVEN